MPAYVTTEGPTIAEPAARPATQAPSPPAQFGATNEPRSAPGAARVDALAGLLARSVTSRGSASGTLARMPDVWDTLGYGFWILEEDGTYTWHSGLDSTGYVATNLPKYKDATSWRAWSVFRRPPAAAPATPDPTATAPPQPQPPSVAQNVPVAQPPGPPPGLNFPPAGLGGSGLTPDADSAFGHWHIHAINSGPTETLQPVEPSPEVGVFRMFFFRFVDEPLGLQHIAFDQSATMLTETALSRRKSSRAQQLRDFAIARAQEFVAAQTVVTSQEVLDRREALVQRELKRQKEEQDRLDKGVDRLKEESKAKLGQGSSTGKYVPRHLRQGAGNAGTH